MTQTFFSIKQGGHLIAGSLPGKGARPAFIDPPGFFLSTHPKVLMQIKPAYQDVPFIQEKLKNLLSKINCQESAVALWESEMPRYELLPKVKEQLARDKKLLAEIKEEE